MRRLFVLIVLQGIWGATSAQTFNDFIGRLYSLPESQRPAIVDSFMDAVPSFPFAERDTLVHFIYRGQANRINVPGDANNWDPNTFPMSTVSGTDFWYHSHFFEADARLDYKYVINGSNWILDPLNPYTVSGGFGPNSELRMPAYLYPAEIDYRAGIPHGTLQDTMFYSSHLGNTRRIRVYTPPEYSSSDDYYGVILVHDGLEYVTLANMQNTMDYLIWQQRIQPIIAVFVPPVNRTEEYAGALQDEFTAFIMEELLAWVDHRFRTLTDPVHRATLGASNGGNIALWLGTRHPENFGNIAAQSSNVQTSIANAFQQGPPLDLRVYLDLGTYDIPELIPMVRNLVSILAARGYTYRYYEYHEGHSWGNWRAHLDNALEMFFPPEADIGDVPDSHIPNHTGLNVYPNPFNNKTSVELTLPRTGRIHLRLVDILGRTIRTMADGEFSAGTHHLSIDSVGLSSGIYFAVLQSLHAKVTKKVLLVK